MENSELALVRKIHDLFKAKGLRLSLAESCTGGLISHMITSLPGASEFFEASIVSYSKKSKENILGIGKYTLKKHGTISEETAIEMANSVRSIAGSEFSLAITGNLGPGTMEGKKAGLVFMAVSSDKVIESKGMIFEGSREDMKNAAAIAALQFLYEVASIWT